MILQIRQVTQEELFLLQLPQGWSSSFQNCEFYGSRLIL